MTEKRRLPFQNLSAQGWQNLALAAIFAFYAAQVGLEIFRNNLFISVGADYLSFWSVGHIANTQGYEDVYDLDVLKGVQEPLVPDPDDSFKVFTPVPTPFLPIFILPFQALALLRPAVSFLVWTAFNLLVLILYLRFFIRSIAPQQSSDRLLILLLVSFPIFSSLFWGQVNVFLVICVGEFLRAAMGGKAFRAGLWLGGLLLKPQILILIGPALLLQRSWKTLLGFATIAAALLAASIGLAGLDGLYNMASLWLGYAGGLPTNAPENMMNWRMLALHLGAFTTPTLGWGFAIAGMILTILAGLYLWLRRIPTSARKFVVAVFGTLAATGAATWHSHLHMLMVLIPAFIYLFIQDRLPAKALSLWVFSLPVAMFLAFVLGLMMKFELLPLIQGIGGLLMGITGLGLNLYFLVWSVGSQNKRFL